MRRLMVQLVDPEARRTWDAILRAKAEVDSWPAWKRGGEMAEDQPDVVQQLTERVARLEAQVKPLLRRRASAARTRNASRKARQLVGACVDCGSKDLVTSSHCEPHRQAHNQRQRARVEKKRQAARAAEHERTKEMA